MNRRFIIFVIRWLANSFGLWIAVRLLGVGHESISIGIGVAGFLIAGLIFSIVNSVIKPIVVVLALPAIAISLGLFMLVVNGLMVYLSLKISHSISMTFLNSIYTGLLLSLINYIIGFVLTSRKIDSRS